MKDSVKKIFVKFNNVVSLKRIISVFVGVILISSSFYLGMAYQENLSHENVQAYENEKDNDDKWDTTLQGTNDESNNDETNSDEDQDLTSSATTTSSADNPTVDTNQLSTVFSKEKLLSFNGQNGAKSYVAYNGKIYDVSTSKYFVNGVHIYDPNVKAGTDITNQMKNAPSSHAQYNYIELLPVIGVLAGSESLTPTPSANSNQTNPGVTSTPTQPASQVQQFTLATLLNYNGKNGAKSYIAYSGVIYDVTNSTYFVNGVHKYDSSVKAGTDITVQMNQAPSSHTSRNYIATLPKVGVLVDVITNNPNPSTAVNPTSAAPTPIVSGYIDDDDDDDDDEYDD